MYLVNWADSKSEFHNMTTKEAITKVAETWKEWCEDEDITMALLAECDGDFKKRGLEPKPRPKHKGKAIRFSKTRAGLQCMLRSYETHIV